MLFRSLDVLHLDIPREHDILHALASRAEILREDHLLIGLHGHRVRLDHKHKPLHLVSPSVVDRCILPEISPRASIIFCVRYQVFSTGPGLGAKWLKMLPS